jgi:tetratricopeptide (TPR) repeat protein
MLTACGGFGMNDQQLLERAAEYTRNGEIQAAVIELKNILQRNPDNAEARYRLASIYLEYEDFPAAERQFRLAGEAGWNPAESCIGLVKSMLKQDEYSAALKACVVEDAFPANDQADLTALRALALAGLGQQENALATLSAAEQYQPDAALVLQTRIDFLMAAGNTAEAARVTARARERHPDNAGLKLREAALLASEQDLTQADERLREVIALDPPGFISGHGHSARLTLVKIRIIGQNYSDTRTFIKPLYGRDTEALYLGALLAYQEDNFELAEELLLKLFSRSPGNLPSMQLYGMVSYSQENYEKAAYYLAKYVSANPDNLTARKQLGLAYMKLGQFDEAGATLSAETDEEIADTEQLTLAIVNAFSGGDNRTGILLLERAVKADPDNLPLRGELARAYLFSGQTERAIETYEAILAQGGQDSEIEKMLMLAQANLALRDGNTEKLLELAKQMQQSQPDIAVGYELEGIALMSQKSYTRASRSFRMAWDRAPSSKLAIKLSASLKLSGQQASATQPLTDWLSEHPEDTRVRQLLGTTWMELGETDKAIETYEQVIRDEPDNVVALNNLAWLYGLDRNPRALVLAETALKEAPDDPGIQDTCGWLHVQQGQIKEGRHLLEKALQQLPDSPEIRYHYAVALYQSGDHEKALGMLKDLLAEDSEFTGRSDAQRFLDEKQS